MNVSKKLADIAFDANNALTAATEALDQAQRRVLGAVADCEDAMVALRSLDPDDYQVERAQKLVKQAERIIQQGYVRSEQE